MNLVRLGHYHTPTGTIGEDSIPEGACRTALVVDNRETDYVGLAVWNYNGGQETRRRVKVGSPQEGEDSFHLSGDCPWGR